MAELSSFELNEITAYLSNPADIARMRAVCMAWRQWVEEPTVYNETIAEVLELSRRDLLDIAIRKDSIELARIALSKVSRDAFDIHVFDDACSRARDSIAELIILHYDKLAKRASNPAAVYNMLFVYAVQNGRVNPARMLIQRGANNFDDALLYACFSHNIDGAKFAIAHGATNFTKAFLKACKPRAWHIYRERSYPCAEIVELLLPKISNINTLNKGLRLACSCLNPYGGDATAARAIIARGANAYCDALEYSCSSDTHFKFTQYAISCSTSPASWKFPTLTRNNLETAKMMLNYGLIVDADFCLNAIAYNDISLIISLILSENGTTHISAIMTRMHALEEAIETPEDFDRFHKIMRAIAAYSRAECPVCSLPLRRHINSRPRPPPRPASPSDN